MISIFICYRRRDSAPTAYRVHERLVAHFREVFIDIDDLPLGTDFRQELEKVLAKCDVVLAVIGNSWVGSRLHEPTDVVRTELEHALERGIRVIPLLIDGATMPDPSQLPAKLTPLAYKNGLPLDSGRDFNVHVARLIRELEKPNPEKALQILRDALDGKLNWSDKDMQHFKDACQIVAEAKRPEALDLLTRLANSASTESVRREANAALEKLGLRHVVRAEEEALEAVAAACRGSWLARLFGRSRFSFVRDSDRNDQRAAMESLRCCGLVKVEFLGESKRRTGLTEGWTITEEGRKALEDLNGYLIPVTPEDEAAWKDLEKLEGSRGGSYDWGGDS
jgi:hypothetical protein